MKKIKKLTLNKEVVSILGGNNMNLVKGGVYSVDESCGTCVACAGGGGGGGGDTGVQYTCINCLNETGKNNVVAPGTNVDSCAVCYTATACGTKC